MFVLLVGVRLVRRRVNARRSFLDERKFMGFEVKREVRRFEGHEGLAIRSELKSRGEVVAELYGHNGSAAVYLRPCSA